jgi:flavin reductase (DIM6/NTAB) family NADH-FMN oxidoreductase RutF
MDMAVNFTQNLELAMENLHKRGAFLTVKNGDKVNTMTISWGSIGYEWARPTFTVMIRQSRYTHELIENSDEFTVSIPLSDELKNALAICGTKSGRDCDKMSEANISLREAKMTKTPVISGNSLHYECKIVFKQHMDSKCIHGDILNSSYKNGDLHTIYYGEILECYVEEK